MNAATRLRWAGGLFVLFMAFGIGSWTSGAAAWTCDGFNARSRAVVRAGEIGWYVGFAITVIGAPMWYRMRCRRGRSELSGHHVAAAMLSLPTGAIMWAIFVDAIAWHRKADIVRTPVDFAIMYMVLTAAIPIALIVPLLIRRWARLSDAAISLSASAGISPS